MKFKSDSKKYCNFFILFLILLFSINTFSMDKSLFDGLIKNLDNRNITKVENFLNENKKKFEKDPEYYVILINFVIKKADNTYISVGKGNVQEGDLAILDNDSKKTVGFLGPRGGYDKEIILDGIVKTRKAINNFKERLDIHFGIISIAELIKDWKIIGEQLQEILKISVEIDNKWKWGPINSMDEKPRDFMINNVQGRLFDLFYLNNKIADVAFKETSLLFIKLYPDLIYGYANLGTFYMAQNDYKKSMNYYQKALKIDPKDEIVLGNIEKLKKMNKFTQ